MALDAVLAKEAHGKLDDGLKKEYVERNGMFFLDVKPSEIKDKDGKAQRFALEDIRGLKNSLQAERDEKSELAKKVKGFDGVDLQEAKDAIAKLKSYGGKEPSDEEAVKERLGSMKKELEEKHNEVLGRLKSDIKTLETDNSKLLIDDRIRDALGGQKLIDGGAKLLTPFIKSQINVVKDESTGDRRAVVIDPSTGKARMSMRPDSTDYMDVEEFVESMAEDKEYGAIFRGTDKSGTLGKGGTKTTHEPGTRQEPEQQSRGSRVHQPTRNPAATLMEIRDRQAASGD